MQVVRTYSRDAQFQAESVNPEAARAVRRHNTTCGVVIFDIYDGCLGGHYSLSCYITPYSS